MGHIIQLQQLHSELDIRNGKVESASIRTIQGISYCSIKEQVASLLFYQAKEPSICADATTRKQHRRSQSV